MAVSVHFVFIAQTASYLQSLCFSISWLLCK